MGDPAERTCLNVVVIKSTGVLRFPHLLNDTGALENVLSHELECQCNKGIIYDERKLSKRRSFQ